MADFDNVFEIDSEDKTDVDIENNTVDINGNTVKGVLSKLGELSESFSSLKTGFENVLTGLSNMLVSETKTENIKAATDEPPPPDDESSIAGSIYNSSNLEDLIEKISDDYSFDQDTGYFKCEVCLEKKDPYLKGALSDKTGIFKIDLDAYQACLALSPNTQPECFRNLKKALSIFLKGVLSKKLSGLI